MSGGQMNLHDYQMQEDDLTEDGQNLNGESNHPPKFVGEPPYSKKVLNKEHKEGRIPNQVDEAYSVNFNGILGYMKFMMQTHPDKWNFDLKKVQKTLMQSNSKQGQKYKKTMIGSQKGEGFGYRLEKRIDFKVPVLITGNNFYRNHSQISKKYIYRKYKGPLYNEAGRVCIDLTQKYLMLESFWYTTILDSMRFQICYVQAERIHL